MGSLQNQSGEVGILGDSEMGECVPRVCCLRDRVRSKSIRAMLNNGIHDDPAKMTGSFIDFSSRLLVLGAMAILKSSVRARALTHTASMANTPPCALCGSCVRA